MSAKILPAKPVALKSLATGAAVLTMAECARKLRVAPQSILNSIESGELQALDLRSSGAGRACWRIPKEAWDDYLARRDSLKTGGKR